MLFLAMLMVMADSKAISLIKDGKVATLSTDYKGCPFGSLTPYALDGEGRPIVYLSSLAIHTKNIGEKPDCSIMVAKVGDDLFNSARITLIGKMVKVVGDKDLEKEFFSKHADAKEFSKYHDFHFYRLEVRKIYYVGGFGDIQWIRLKDYQAAFKK